LIVAVDTDALVTWSMSGDERHARARAFFERTVTAGDQLGLLPQVLWEFLHVTTDGRRFEKPMTMEDALAQARLLWDSADTSRVIPTPVVVHRVLDLMRTLRLGRKRILDTALAATLIEARIQRLVTWNPGDFLLFDSIEAVAP